MPPDCFTMLPVSLTIAQYFTADGPAGPWGPWGPLLCSDLTAFLLIAESGIEPFLMSLPLITAPAVAVVTDVSTMTAANARAVPSFERMERPFSGVVGSSLHARAPA